MLMLDFLMFDYNNKLNIIFKYYLYYFLNPRTYFITDQNQAAIRLPCCEAGEEGKSKNAKKKHQHFVS